MFNLMYQKRMKEESDKVGNYSTCQQLCYILTKCDYLNVLICLTALYLIMSGIQYWITDYVISVLGHTKETAFMIYIFVGALGPILGVACSGCVFDRIGGYHGRNTPIVFSIFLVISGTLGLLSVMFDNLAILTTCILL